MAIKRLIKNRQNNIFFPVLIIVLVLAAYLRLDGISWDDGFSYSPHPDERAILIKVSEIDFPDGDISSLWDKDKSSWNPRWFAYGTFPMYLLNTIEAVINSISSDKALDLRIIGRVLSALADLGTVSGVAMLGRRFFSPSVGLLASVFTAFAVIHIQLAHFFTFDTFITFFSIWALYFLYKVMKTGDKKYSIISGALIGVGIASKFSVFVLLAPFLTAHIVFALQKIIRSPSKNTQLSEIVFSGIMGISAAFIAFTLVQPYALLDWATFWSHIQEQSEMVRRLRDYPYTRQYIDTTAYLYQTIQMGRWGLGWPLTLLSIASIIWALTRGKNIAGILSTTAIVIVIPAIILLFTDGYIALFTASSISLAGLISTRILHIDKYANTILLMSWVIPYLLITGSFEVKFIRYILPVLPILFVMCSALLMTKISESRNYKSAIWSTLVIVTVFTTVIYGLSIKSVYSNKHTAVSAAHWLNEKEPNGAKLLKEHWEESLPNLYKHSVSELPIYDPDNPSKINKMANSLEVADYIIIYSNRMYGTVTRLPERYPLMTSYYHSLFSGYLGYELVNVQTSYLSIFGIDFVEDTFNRPDIANPIDLSSSKGRNNGMNIGFADESFSVYDHPKVLLFKNKLRLNSDTIKQIIYENSKNHSSTKEGAHKDLMMSDVLKTKQQSGGTWSEIISPNSLGSKYPTITWLLIIELLSIIVLPVVFLIFNSFTYKGYLFSKILGIFAVCFLTWWLNSLSLLEFNKTSIWMVIALIATINTYVFIRNRQKFTNIVKINWKSFITLELIFLLLFGIFLMVRAMNPDLWHPYRGGEKPMDIAYLNAVLKSTYMPPYDPWFAGGYLNYYYWGQFVVASLIHLSGITTEIAYNLAVATFFALAGAIAVSIGINLASHKNSSSARLKILGGGSAVLFILIIGNMDGLYQILELTSNFINQGIWGEFDFWRSSRMMPPDPPGFEITEFPFFTFLFADLHAHLMAIPFGLLVIGTSMTLAKKGNYEQSRWLHWSQLSLLSISLGALWAINTWDVPIYGIVTAMSIFIFQHRSHGGLNILVFTNSIIKMCLVVVIALIGFLPYHLASQTFFNSFELTTNLTSFKQIISINGLFIFISLSGLLILARFNFKTLFHRLNKLNLARLLRTKVNILQMFSYLFIFAAIIATFAVVLTGMIGGAIPVGIIGFIIGSVALYKSLQSKPDSFHYQTFAIVISLAAFSIIIGVDILRVEGDIDRMNTVFKFYLQAWILFSISSVFMILKMSNHWINHGLKTTNLLWLTVFVVMLVASLTYPIFGTQDRLRDRFDNVDQTLTLDGYRFATGTVYMDPTGEIPVESDLIAIKWIRENIKGSPVILEGWTPSYRWGSRISTHTGLPTVVGWKWHQEQQRWRFRQNVSVRIADVNTIYTSNNSKIVEQLIQKYNISYIVVGNLEKLYYPSSGLFKFETGMNGLTQQVYESDEVIIYKVNQKQS